MASSSMVWRSTRFASTSSRLRSTLVAPSRLNFQHRRLSVAAAAYQEAPAARNMADYSIYKSKAAVTFKPIPPTFAPTPSGGGTSFAVDREGVLLLEFANAQAAQGQQTGYGSRSYDWQNKITFALKAQELAQLTDFDIAGPATGSSELKFIHDPNKGNPNAGQGQKTIKTLRMVVQEAGHGAGYMLSIGQVQGTAKAFVSVPIAREEFAVLKALAAYAIPRLYGWDYLFELQGSYPPVAYQPQQQQ